MSCCDIVCRRDAGRAVVEGVPHEWVWHSPAGFEWGYGGSGPADLALNILLAATGDRGFAAKNHQAFKWKFVAALTPKAGLSVAPTLRSGSRARPQACSRFSKHLLFNSGPTALLVMVLLPYAMLFAGLISLMVLIALPIPAFFKGVIALGWWMLRDDGGRGATSCSF